jgi:DnaJ-class molecular chaperone
MRSVGLLFALAALQPCAALFGWGSGAEDGGAGARELVQSRQFGCVAWKSVRGCRAQSDNAAADGPDKACTATVGSRESGFCQCAWGEVSRVDCGHQPLTCEQACYADFGTRKTGAQDAWLVGSVWNWNSWRDVELQARGVFMAPTPECEARECRWFAQDGAIYIMWGQAGLHSVTVSADKRSLKGMRYDGDACSGAFVRSSEGSGSGGDVGGAGSAEDEPASDLYEELGLDAEEASEADIKKAFRRLSLEFHPDRVQASGADPARAARRFERVREAYEVLSSPDKKLLYDTGGLEAVREAAASEGREQAEGGGGLFGFMFGGGGGGASSKRGRNQEYELTVTLADLYNGNDRMRTSVDRRVVCVGCDKTTPKNRERCARCQACPPEVRMVQRQMGGFIINQQEQVPSKHKCRNEPAKLEVTIERGMKAGDKLTFPRMAEQTPGKIPGDITLEIKVQDHAQFRRNGDDLFTVVHVPLKDALCGFRHSFAHLDGHSVDIETAPPQIIRPFERRRIEGEGMPLHNTPSQFGALEIEFNVLFPDALSQAQRDRLGDVLPDQRL